MKNIENILEIYKKIEQNKLFVESVYSLPSNIRANNNVDLDIKNSLQTILDKVFQEYRKGATITSGTRSKEHNINVGGSSESKHLSGDAVDVVLDDNSVNNKLDFIKIASKHGIRGIGIYERDNSIHLDMGKRRVWGDDYTNKTIPDWAKKTAETHLKNGFSNGGISLPSSEYDDLNIIDRGRNSGIGKIVTKAFGLPENHNFLDKNILSESYKIPGKNTVYRRGVIVLPEKSNKKIKSGVSGRVNNVRYNRNCKNQVTIQHTLDGEKYYLEYCGISNPKVYDGDVVTKEQLIGETDKDVVVILYNSSYNQIPLNKKQYSEKKYSDIGGNKSNYSKDKDAFSNPLLSAMVLAPFAPFRNKEEGGKKIWGSPTDDKQVDQIFKSPTEEESLKESLNKIKNIFTKII